MIDSSFRGGVTPKLYPVFGADKPGVRAAGLFDVNRLFRGMPSGAKQDYTYSQFPGGYTYIGYYDQKCDSKRHPLTNDAGDVFGTTFNVVNIFKADTTQTSRVVHRLFGYSGKSVKVRLWAHITTNLRRAPAAGYWLWDGVRSNV